MDIAKSETLRGFTELSLFYNKLCLVLMILLAFFSLLYSFRSVFIHTMLSQSIRVCARD